MIGPEAVDPSPKSQPYEAIETACVAFQPGCEDEASKVTALFALGEDGDQVKLATGG